MPVELIAFTADRRISGAIPLADDRMSDMLNSVPRVVVRNALVEDLVDGRRPFHEDLTVPVGSLFAVLVTGRRGVENRRRRTDVHRARIGLTRFVVSGMLHVPAGTPVPPSHDPSVVLARRDILVPLTDASISYDQADDPTTEHFETILVNRSHATWIDLDDAAWGDEDGDLVGTRRRVYHAALVKDHSGAS